MTIEQLKKLPVFLNFKTQDLKEVLKSTSIKTLKPKEELFVRGQKRDTFFIVLTGEVSIWRHFGKSARVVKIVDPGGYIAEHALSNPKSKHSHSARANKQPTSLLALPGKLFKTWSSRTKCQLLLNLLPIISDNFSHASNKILTLSQIGQALGQSSLPADQLGINILSILLTAINAEKALIALQNIYANKVEVRIVSTYGFGQKENDIVNKTVKLSEDFILERIIKHKELINIPAKQYLNSKQSVDYIKRCVLGMPLTVGDKILGAILLIDKKNQDRFNSNNEVLLSIVAQMIALGIFQARQRETYEAQEELGRQYIHL